MHLHNGQKRMKYAKSRHITFNFMRHLTFRFLMSLAASEAISVEQINESVVHSDSESPEIGMLVMDQSLMRSLFHSYRSLVRLLRTACFDRVLRGAY